jgi:serine/threonine protein phosphatase PrpC
MQNVLAMLYCPNYSCQTPNPETHRFCQKCRTLLPRHYLWGVGTEIASYQPGALLGNRYLCKNSRIFLDTKPGLVPETITEVPQAFVSYLRLSPYQLHIPQVYEILPSDLTDSKIEILLLGQASVFILSEGEVHPLPTLTEVWSAATALRQLNWLWQIAQLWQPLSGEKVASSLLTPELLRVEGSIVRLLELSSDEIKPPTLAQMGQVWTNWIATAQPPIAPLLEQICQQLTQGEIRSAEQLVSLLDQGLAAIGLGQIRQIQIATLTDQGPTRQRNEDACYPPSHVVKTQTISADQTAADPALAIVCDGIGGHQGGNVASMLAIATAQQQLQSLHPELLDAIALTGELEQVALAANDQISQRNDSEKRFERQRMGTTLVMGLARAHELYITHVGDSRAYWITRQNCRQVTLDDDIAAREVRLGYSSYREALQQPGAGSLVQALGMGASTQLHPTVQRFVLDEDCVFLLCSDGLSDHDRVEEVWETEILPLLEGKVDLATVSQRLVAIANTLNGHDNVTVALIYCQVTEQQNSIPTLALPTLPTTSPSEPSQRADLSTPQPLEQTIQLGQSEPDPSPTSAAANSSGTRPATTRPVTPRSTASELKTQILPAQPRQANPLSLGLSIFVLLGIGGLLAYFFFPSISRRVDPLIGLAPSAAPASSTTPTATASPSPLASSTALPIQINAFVRVDRPTPSPTVSPDNSLPDRANPTAVLLDQPAADPTIAPAGKVIPLGSILQVVQVVRRGTSPQDSWVRVQVCSIPRVTSTNALPSPSSVAIDKLPKPDSTTATPTRAIQPGEIGWIQETVITPPILSRTDLTSDQQGSCAS